jgi:hypothetical protein
MAPSTSRSHRRSSRRAGPLVQHLPLSSQPSLLHHMVAVLDLAGRRPPDDERSAAQRRRRQRLALAQQLFDPLPPALRPADEGSERFWRALRWGGVGLLLAWLLGR